MTGVIPVFTVTPPRFHQIHPRDLRNLKDRHLIIPGQQHSDRSVPFTFAPRPWLESVTRVGSKTQLLPGSQTTGWVSGVPHAHVGTMLFSHNR